MWHHITLHIVSILLINAYKTQIIQIGIDLWKLTLVTELNQNIWIGLLITYFVSKHLSSSTLRNHIVIQTIEQSKIENEFVGSLAL